MTAGVKEVFDAERTAMGGGKCVLLRGYETKVRPIGRITFILYWHIDRASVPGLRDRRLISLRYAVAFNGRVDTSGIIQSYWRKVKHA